MEDQLKQELLRYFDAHESSRAAVTAGGSLSRNRWRIVETNTFGEEVDVSNWERQADEEIGKK